MSKRDKIWLWWAVPHPTILSID